MTPTPSLQRRVTLVVLALLTVLLVVLGVTIDVTMGVLARRNLHDRLLAATSRADALSAAHTAPTCSPPSSTAAGSARSSSPRTARPTGTA